MTKETLPPSEIRGACTPSQLWAWLNDEAPCDWETDVLATVEMKEHKNKEMRGATVIVFWTKEED